MNKLSQKIHLQKRHSELHGIFIFFKYKYSVSQNYDTTKKSQKNVQMAENEERVVR